MTEIKIHKTQESDITTVLLMENDIENSRFIFPNSKEEHLALLKDDNVEHLLLSENNNTIGFVILAGIKNKNRNVEFRRIVIKAKGKGFGRKAIQKLKQYSFEMLNCHRFWLDVLETNKRARYLYQSEGFKEEGTLRDCIVIDNEYASLIVMSILEDEYKNNSTKYDSNNI